MSPTLRNGLFALGAAVLVLAVAGIGYLSITLTPAREAATAGSAPDVGGPFTLVDHNGRTVSDSAYRGALMLVSFGYTYCPDVCPTTLSVIGDALDALGPEADAVQPIFITIDPERDTPEFLADYVGHFHPRLVGLTGTPEQIAAVAKAYRVYYKKAMPHGAQTHGAADYLMDHSTATYLMGPDGRMRAFLPHTTNAEAMAAKIRETL